MKEALWMKPELSDFFPVWDKLKNEERKILLESAEMRHSQAGEMIHNGSEGCEGLLCLVSGQLRAFILSEEGREISIYRLLEGDICLFSASCMMSGIQFDIFVEAEKTSSYFVIPASVYKKIMEESAVLANFTNELMAARMSYVMWLIGQILWKGFDRRLASFLLEESAMDGTDDLYITHEKIADHLGTAREVVTRMLRYFQSEGLVQLSRSHIVLKKREGLEKLAG